MITATLGAILNVSGVAAMTASDGHSALEIASLIPPEVLIADLVLPGLNGLELATHVTQRFPDCEVILFTDNSPAAAANIARGGLRGSFRLLLKPVHPADLLQAVFALLIPHGHNLTIPREVNACSPYDLLTTVRPVPEILPLGLNLTRRQHATERL
jgi:two-component system cell cycle response regulator CpdR